MNTQQAHSLLASIMQDRKARQGKVLRYKLHCTNRLGEVQQTVQGYTIRDLMKEFRSMGGNFRYAFITDLKGDKLYRGFDRQLSRKWVSYTAGKKK